MIRITSQNGTHQYDSQDRAITTWDHKKCCWIVNPEFEKEKIDWYGKDSDFPQGCTLAQFIERNPNWDKMPDINVTWYWNTKESCIAGFGLPHTFGEKHDYWDKQTYPYMTNRSWGYIDEPKETTVENFGKYCKFHKHADRTLVTYNGETLFDGKLI
jgi:hypothetical protein